MSETQLPSIAVLLATYGDEHASRLDEALNSILTQTLAPQAVELVIDGPIDTQQEKIIEKYSALFSITTFRVCRLSQRGGLAAALNAGLRECTEEIIARMDSDDIAVPTRLEEQWNFLQSHPEINLVAGWQAEFEDDVTHAIRSVKESPATHEEIVRQMKWRNIISHPTIMVRRESLLRVGGYDESVGLLEDYDLHMRMIHSGARYAVLQQPMVLVRVSRKQRVRRGGWRYVGNEWAFRYRCMNRGDLSIMEFIFTTVANTIFRLLPSLIKDPLYHIVRRTA